MYVLNFSASSDSDFDLALLNLYQSNLQAMPKKLLWAFCLLDLRLGYKVDRALQRGLSPFDNRSALMRLHSLERMAQRDAKRKFFSWPRLETSG